MKIRSAFLAYRTRQAVPGSETVKVHADVLTVERGSSPERAFRGSLFLRTGDWGRTGSDILHMTEDHEVNQSARRERFMLQAEGDSPGGGDHPSAPNPHRLLRAGGGPGAHRHRLPWRRNHIKETMYAIRG